MLARPGVIVMRPPDVRHPAVVLCPARLSASLVHPLYEEAMDGRPFLAWWVARVQARLRGAALRILCYTHDDEARIASILGGAIPTLRVTGGSRLQCFAAAAAAANAADVAFVQEGFAFAPEDLLARVNAHHVRHGNLYTRVTGFPPGTAPELYQSEFLADLLRRRLEAGQGPRHGRSIAEASRPSVAFDAAGAYAASPADLPERVLFEFARDFEIARRVIASAAAGDAPLRDLRLWRKATIALQQEYRAARRAAPLDTVRPRTRGAIAAARVLYVSNPSAYTGAEASWCQLIAHLDPARFTASALIGREGLLTERLRALGVHVISPGHGFDGEHFDEDLSCVLRAIRTCAPDLLHFNAPSGPAALYAAILCGVPVVAHCRVASFAFHRELLRSADAIVAVSEYVKRLALRLDIAEERISVVHNAVDVQRFRPGAPGKAEARARLGLPAEATIVATIARYAQNKRHDLLLRAAADVKSRIPSLHLVLNGEIDDAADTYDAVMGQIRALGMQSWVTMIPFVADVRFVHAAADLLVLCSESEPLGRCVLEAMAMEVPAIITDAGGLTEIVSHGQTGFLVQRDDPAGLARQMAAVLSDRALAARIGTAARSHVAATLDPGRLARRVMALYDDVVARSQSNSGAEVCAHPGIARERIARA